MPHISVAIRPPHAPAPYMDKGLQARVAMQDACKRCAEGCRGWAGGHDALADPEDMATLTAALAPGVVVASHQEPSYEHMDYTWGENAHALVYPQILALLLTYA